MDVGTEVSFTCLAEYTLKKISRYDWEHNNQTLTLDNRITAPNDGRELKISPTKFEDRGDYRCVAIRSRDGRKDVVLGKSQNAALNVKGMYDTTYLSRD